MYSKVLVPEIHGKYTFDNKGSCSKLVNYLNKENENVDLEDIELFFSHDDVEYSSSDVEHSIDNNKKGLAKDRAKFHSLVIAPDEAERELLGSNKLAFKDYIREVMNEYAKNFNDKKGSSGFESKDLVWFAKVENERKGEKDNLHAHIIVSARDRKMKKSISPNVNDKGRFNRVNWYLKNEEVFDQLFHYERAESLLKTHQIEKYGSLDMKIKNDQELEAKKESFQLPSKQPKKSLNKDNGIKKVVVKKNITPIEKQKGKFLTGEKTVKGNSKRDNPNEQSY